MKNILFLFVFLLPFLGTAQDVNQLDAEGKRHGVWKKNFEDTDVLRYQGEFSHGKEIGVFKFYKKVDGKAVLAANKQFHTDSDIAQVSFYASSGKLISEGQMNGKLYVGTWTYYQNKTKSVLSKDTYNDKGELDGDRFVYYVDGILAQKESYVNGKLHGPSTWYTEKSIVVKEYVYDTGELHGPATFYDKTGVMVLQGQYQRDRKHGVWKYYENGKLVKEKDFTRKSNNPYKR